MSFIKQLAKYILYSVINMFVYPQKSLVNKTILLIRLDAIGDYVLFRNFIEILKKTDEYKHYSITLVGNIIWKELATELEKDYISKFIWIDKKKFERNLFYRHAKLREITHNGYEIIFNPTYSRDFYCGDWIAKLVSAKEKIASIGDLSNMSARQKRISDQFYTKLIPATQNIVFEFYRNREFFESLLKRSIQLSKPHIDISKLKINLSLPKNYVVLFLGASAAYRKWSPKNFAKIAQHIQNTYQIDILLAGSSSELNDVEEFNSCYSNENIFNLVGKTTLLELLYIISNSELLISNETSAPHFSVALGTNALVISNGNHYGRFTPYPPEMTNLYNVIYPSLIEENLDHFQKMTNQYGCGSNLNINDISIESVIKKIDCIMKKEK